MEDNKGLKNTLNESIEIEEIVDTTNPQATVVKESEVFSSEVSERKERKELALPPHHQLNESPPLHYTCELALQALLPVHWYE